MAKTLKNSNTTKQKQTDMFLLFLLIATVFVFIKGMSYDLLNFDDNEYFDSYPEILNLSFESIKKYFSSYYVLMYQPLPILSFALTYSFVKLDPTAHHIINLGFHLLNIYLVYVFIGKLTDKPFVKQAVAFLFALHPLAVEPVMWISGRSSGMYVCFYLPGLISYLNYRQSGKTKTLMLCGLWFILSLFSKVHAVTFPLTLLVLDFFHFKFGFNKKISLEKIPFFLLSLVFGIIAIRNTETAQNIAFSSSAYSFVDYIFILFYELGWYLFKLFFPLNLSPIYVYPIKTEGMLPLVYYTSFIIVLGIAFLVYKFQKSKPYLLFGLVFFYVSLVFTFQILPSRLFIVADRYGYLANIGVFYILALWFTEWKEGKINWLKDFSGKHYISYIIGVAVLFLTFKQTSVWENNKTVANRIIETNPETPYLARAYGVKANYEKDILKNPEQALADYEKAIELDSNDWVSPYQAGLLYQSLGDSASTIRYFKLAIKADKTSPLAFTDWGVLLSAQNQHSKALSLADSALKRKPYFPNALLLKAVSLLNLGNIMDAEKNLNLCISKNPAFAPAYKNRGIVRLNNLNNKEGACSDFKKAAELGEPGMDQILKDYCN